MTMNQDNQTPGQNDNFAAGGEEFVFTEERKPVNRNLMVLLLIAVVGGGLIYFMYLRNRDGGTDDEATRVKSEQVAEFIKKGDEDLKKLDQVLQNMDKQTSAMVGDSGAGQVKTEDLKTNPFQFKKADADETPRVAPGPFVDERQAIAKVANKVEVQMISWSPRGSTCILNSKLCSEGDQITLEDVTFTVKQIAQDYVMLEHKLGSYKVMVKGKGL